MRQHRDHRRGVPIYWLNGNKVADDYADFYDNSWDDESDVRNEHGNPEADREIWTGSDQNGVSKQVMWGCCFSMGSG